MFPEKGLKDLNELKEKEDIENIQEWKNGRINREHKKE